jgi:hypothetical protein
MFYLSEISLYYSSERTECRCRGDSEGGMDRGAAMLAVVLDVYEGGKDLIPGWKLKEHSENAFATGGVEGLRRYYEACLTGSGHRVKTTLEGDRRKTLECTWVLPGE